MVSKVQTKSKTFDRLSEPFFKNVQEIIPNGKNGDFLIFKFGQCSNQKFGDTFFDGFRVHYFDFLVKIKIWPVGGAIRPTNF